MNASIEVKELKSQCARSLVHSFVIARQRHILRVPSQVVHGGKMQCVKRTHRARKRLERALKRLRSEFNQRQAGDQATGVFSMRITQVLCVHASPNLVLKESARHEVPVPKLGRRAAVLGEDFRKHDRCVDKDHRSARSASSSDSTLSNVPVLSGEDVASPTRISGGRTNPFLTASARNTSAISSPRPGLGGDISATTLSRSVTRTVSPCDAKRKYSLKRLFSTLMPTARME